MSGPLARVAGAMACLVVLAGPARTAEPGLSCEQIYAAAQATVVARDRGDSLKSVLRDLVDAGAGKLTPVDLEILRRAVTAVFLGQSSPEEVGAECVTARGRTRR